MSALVNSITLLKNEDPFFSSAGLGAEAMSKMITHQYFVRDVIFHKPKLANRNSAEEKFLAELINKNSLSDRWITLSFGKRCWSNFVNSITFQADLPRNFIASIAAISPEAYLTIEGNFQAEVRVLSGGMSTPEKFIDRFILCFNCEKLQQREPTQPGDTLNHSLQIPIPNQGSIEQHLAKYKELRWQLSVTVTLEWQKARESTSALPIKLDSNLFAKNSTKDVSVKVGSGAAIKCHGFLLAAHSPVFAKMLSPENGMREAQTRTILLEENSEKGMNLLIQYLYGIEVTAEKLESDMALELLQAAHKYELPKLEEDIGHVLLQKGPEWFTPDAILELYFFVKKLEKSETLCGHLLEIMTGMAREIRSCQRFQELDPAERVDLAWTLLEKK